jgi:hypothetical protein
LAEFMIDVSEHDAGAQVGERLREAQSKASRCSRDDGSLAGEIIFKWVSAHEATA